jgi:nitrogen-specific signal transduction histidine kinase
MKKARSRKHQARKPSGTLAHELINRLSVIVGNCDLLKDALPRNSESANRLCLIKDVAKSMAEDLQTHETDLDEMMQRLAPRNP